MTTLQRQITGNYDLQKIEDNVRSAFNQIDKVPFLDGILLQSITMVSGTPKVVQHKLRRTILGYFVTKKNANAQIWDTSSTSNTITLNTSANVTISIWVF